MMAVAGNRLRRAALLPIFLVSACSSYGGQKLGLDPQTRKPVAASGIPFMLVRPEYSVTTTPPAAGDAGGTTTYTLSVSYQPDPQQQFSLRTRPGFLADPDFTMNFGAGGTLTSAKTTVTEQFTPWVKAIGSFAGNLAALGVLDKSSQSVKDQLLGKLGDSACSGDAGTPWLDPATLRVTSRTAAQELRRRIEFYDKDETILKRLHYASQPELRCLTAIREPLAQTLKEEVDEAKKAYDDAAKAYSGDAEFKTLVAALVEKKDRVGLKRQQDSLEALRKTDQTLAEKRDLLMTPAASYLRAMEDPLVDLLSAVVKMNAATWRARHVLYIEDEIAAAQLALLRHPDASATDRQRVSGYLAGLDHKRAETIGGLDLYARARSLRDYLSRVPPRGTGGGRISGTGEYVAARTELDIVNERIEALRTKVIAAAKSPEPKPKALKDERVIAVTPTALAATQKKWDNTIVTPNGTTIEAPALVVVLEPIE